MESTLRSAFNSVWSPELFRRVRGDLEARLGCTIPFPVAETPLFLGADLLDGLATASKEIMALLCDPAFIAGAEETVPPAYSGGDRGPLPQLAAIDFAIVEDAQGRLSPRVVELQGFPSLYGFQIMLADVWATHISGVEGLPYQWRLFFDSLDRYKAMAILRATLLGGHDPEEVILLDLDPRNQKTYPDFAVTRHWFGIDPVCPTELEREGDRLFRRREGRRIPVRRIYQRVVPDELEQSDIQMPFRLGEDLNVEWAPHPAWFFLWSKNSLPRLDHWAIPKTRLLSDLDEFPDEPDRWVLKPLYSFAGSGVNVDPTRVDIEAVPEADRAQWVLQEKVHYAPALKSVEGFGVKAEVRCMFARPDDQAEMTLLMNLVRFSRGKMMGVDHNKDLSWTGASVGLWTPDASGG